MLQPLLAQPAIRADADGLQRALSRAVRQGNVEAARLLIDAGADPDRRLPGASLRDGATETYLMLAAASGVWAMLDDALARHPDVHATDGRGYTALVYTALNTPMNEDIFPVVDRLLAAGAKGADLDAMLLVETYTADWIPGLVARGAHVNARAVDGSTPLFHAGVPQAVQALLDAGADPLLRNNAGKTAEETYPRHGGHDDPRTVVIANFLQKKSRAGAAPAAVPWRSRTDAGTPIPFGADNSTRWRF